MRLSATSILAAALCLLVAGCHRSSPTTPNEPRAQPAHSTAQTQKTAPAATTAEDHAAQAEPSAEPPKAAAGSAEARGAAPNPALLDPSKATATAPDDFTVELDTTKGPVLLDVHRAWAPHGADRFYNLVKIGFYDDTAFFRVIDGFMAQVGISGDPAVSRAWREATIPDDPRSDQSNLRGFVSFATAGPNTRTTQFFINLVNNARLDAMGFTPFAKVRDMKAVDALYSGYGEGQPAGRGPSQGALQREGNAYLRRDFPKLDYIRHARVVSEPPPKAEPPAKPTR